MQLSKNRGTALNTLSENLPETAAIRRFRYLGKVAFSDLMMHGELRMCVTVHVIWRDDPDEILENTVVIGII